MSTDPPTGLVAAELGFVLAIDGCARGCSHCPAFGSTGPIRRAPLDTLAQRLASVAAARARCGLPAAPDRTVHCWRISDPLDYTSRTARSGMATIADVAMLWREHLRQGLYVVTNGSEGHRRARRALTALAAIPALVSQMKITITPADRAWGTSRYIDDLAADVRTVAPLWELRANRPEVDPEVPRLRLNVKTTRDDRAQAHTVTVAILQAAGLGRKATRELLDDPQRVAFKPIYDLGTATGTPTPVAGALPLTDRSGTRNKPTPETRPRIQYGIRPDGRLFEVDLYAFTETDLSDPATGQPRYWDIHDG